MKKFLLSIATVAAFTTAAVGQTTLNVDDATNFEGTLVDEVKNDDGSVKAAKHYQPINSLELGGYTITFTTTSTKESQMPAYYWATSTSKNQQRTIRLYTGSTMTIAAPAGVTITGIEFKGSNAGKTLDPTVDTGKISYESNKATWTGSASKVALSTNASWRILTMTVYTGSESPEQPVIPSDDYYTYDLASSIESGKTYAFYASDSVATTVDAAKKYGYLYGEPATEVDGSFEAKASAGFKFTAVEGGYNIQDYIGRYLWLDGNYNSFQFSAEIPAGKESNAVWDAKVAADGTLTMVNVGKNKTVMWSHPYHSFGAYAEILDNMEAPSLYLQSAKGNTPEQPEQPVDAAVYEAVDRVASGMKYVMVIGEQYGAAIAESASYGRLALTGATVAADKVTAPKAAAITIIEVAGKGFIMVDSYGRYLGMDDSHPTSFQLYTEANDGCYWDIEFNEAGEAKIVSKLNPTCFVAQSQGSQGTFYTNIAPADAPEVYNLPKLYVETASAGISDITLAPADGEARYYDLRGRTVNADALTPGIYIRRQGNKAVKVMIR